MFSNYKVLAVKGGVAAITFVLSTATAHAFNGPYAGIAFSFQDVVSEQKVRSGGESAEFDLGGNGIGLSGHLGYNWTNQSGILVGLEVNLGQANAESKVGDGSSIGTYTFEAKESYGVAGQMGRIIGEDLVFYGLAGYQVTNFESRVGGSSDDKNFKGFRAGVGTEYMLKDNVSMRLQYVRTYYGSETYGGGGESVSIKVEESLFNAGVSIHF